MKRLLRHTGNSLLTLVGLTLTMCALGWLARPDVSPRPMPYSQQEIAEAKSAREVRFDPNDPAQLPVLHVDVDYTDGPTAAWWPKRQAPILDELVSEGSLPPLEERIGPEPCVMRGIDGIGKYGGTWHRLATHDDDVDVIRWRLSSTGLVRWSPLGNPIKPHLAKGVEVRNDNREFIIHLRKEVRWSDGHPFTVDDILYWWAEEQHPMSGAASAGATAGGAGIVPKWMRSGGKPARLEKIDDLTLRIAFDEPYAGFMEQLASSSHLMVQSPRHFLMKYHPEWGDQQFIERELKALGMPGRRALYIFVKNFANPEHPRLWPWVYRTYRATPPQVFVRNPYYWVVDEQGNQLPYIDRVQFAVKSTQTLALAFANGEASMQNRHVRYENYTELMSRREAMGMRILHWYPATRSIWVINPNLNRLVDARPDTKLKAQLLAEKRFRQALSLAINRKAIIQAEYNNQVQPAQVEPGPESPFHSEVLRNAFVEHDPARANELLDQLGLTKRSLDGMRLFPDGTLMVFYLDYTQMTGMGPAPFVVDDWAEVGVRVIAREQQRELFYARKDGGDFDFNIWTSESDFYPLIEPRVFVPDTIEAFYAPRWSRWFVNGGYFGDPKVANIKMAEPPPRDHPMWHAYELYERAKRAPTLAEQQRLFAQISEIVAENLWTINIAEAPPSLVVVSADMRNVPRNALVGARLNTPGNAGIETYFFEHPDTSAASQTKQEIQHLTARPRVGQSTGTGSQFSAIRMVGYAFALAAVAGIAILAVRYPFVARRLAIMVPTLLVISIAVFTIIQLPPGDFLTSRLIQLQELGDEAAQRQVAELRETFHFDEPQWKQYARWMGLRWFITFNSDDTGLLQGNMGRSMGEQLKPVNSLVGDRIMLTVLISVGTILLTWLLAIPIGIYSAVRQYTVGDYLLTLLGFVGMSVPGFLLALVLMTLAGVGPGLFSPRFAAQSAWSWPKVVDLFKHIWVPIVVLGVGGTAGMIRIMRANLLDELRKPYVTTARAKGVRPLKLLLKYPVRMALNPFVSGIGHLFPQLVSGGAIVAIVLALPTVGPLMLQALFNQDMYVAGSMLMVLSVLGVVGTLVSDLLLLWLDPRIRYEGGTR